MQKNLLVLLLLLVPFFILGQDLEKKWKFSSIEDSKGNPIAKINKETDYLNIIRKFLFILRRVKK